MLKLESYNSDTFNNFKCGEIFCVSPSVFDLSCLLCSQTFGNDLDKFTVHVQVAHLALAEKTISLNRKRKSKTTKKSLQKVAVKDEDPEDDPINFTNKISVENDLTEPVKGTKNAIQEDDEDDKCLIELINETIGAKSKHEVMEKHNGKQLITEKIPRIKSSIEIPIDNSSIDLNEMDAETSSIAMKTEISNVEPIADVEAVILQPSDGDTKNDVDCEDQDWSEMLDNNDSESSSESEDGLPFPCLICKRSYSTKTNLQKHNHRFHNPNKPPTRKNRKLKPKHKCDICNELFRSARDLGGHMWKHTGIICDVCGKTFSQSGNLIRHKVRHTGIKAHKCKECSKDFFTAKELNAHMICHTGIMPLICEICGKRCRDRGVLKAHMRRHTGERPAKCDVCGKSFFSFHDLNVHAVTHTSDRPFKCDICGSTFQRKKALRVHKLIHSKDRRHVCKICGKGFAQSGGLNSHMRTHDAAIQKSKAESNSLNIPSTHLESQQISEPGGLSSVTQTTIPISVLDNVQVLGEFVV